jgi:hypothetical protein
MNLFYQSDYWEEFSKKDKDTVAKDLHPSWDASKQSYKEITEFHLEALEIIKRGSTFRALDFGIGMGRNYDYLKSVFKEVYGFDKEVMLNNLRKTNKKIDLLTSDWDSLMTNRFDLIFECVVFQHIPPQEVLYRLFCLSKRTTYLYSVTRSYNDFCKMAGFGVNMFKLIDSTNLFKLVYTSSPIEEIREHMDEKHYHMLFKVK